VNPTPQSQINRVIARFYAAFDNRAGQIFDVNGFLEMFLPKARVTRVLAGEVESWTIGEFIAPRAVMLTDGTLANFHEWEIEGATTIFDNIAEHRSQYRKSGVMRGDPYNGGGRKIISLCQVDGSWRIASVLWEDYS